MTEPVPVSIIIAQVALRARVTAESSAIFSYRVPAHLQGRLEAGQLVWVPLRSQTVQGVVLALDPPETSDPPLNPQRLRELSDLADADARIPAAGLHLAPWLAATYHVPLYEALNLLLPPGVYQQAIPTWQATPQGINASLGTLPPHERAILYYLRTSGETTFKALLQALNMGEKRLRDTCELLRERGLLSQGTVVSAPRVRPRIERRARLLPPAPAQPDTLEGWLQAVRETLKRAPKQQAIVDWLATKPPDYAAPVGDIYSATETSLAMLHALERKGLLVLEDHEVRRDPLLNIAVPPDNPPTLTQMQRQVWEKLLPALEALRPDSPPPTPHPAHPDSPVFLLHGVTGSGKTEIYLRAAARAMRLGRQVLVLVPEIALTAQLVRRFAARFPGKVAVLHSNLAPGERYDEWRRLRRGDATLAIGSRSAVFAPLPTLGLLIVDEEHEPSYKHDSYPRYHARDVALHLGQLTGSVVLLGSATPSVESYHAARNGRFTLLEITERVGQVRGNDGLLHTQLLPLPKVRLVDMRQELQQGNTSLFSRPLQIGLHNVLERGEQAILFLNRRGAASFVLCRDCGHVLTCPVCSGSLAVHYSDTNTNGETGAGGQAAPEPREQLLLCHTCNYRELVPAFCPQCLSPRIKSFGVGTQRVEEAVQQLVPGVRTLRWDSDTATGKGVHERLLDQFLNHEADVLIGTQMIAKGLDLPRIGLVGVVAADTALYLPDFRSGERTFQLLTQVAGRAGRRSDSAQVVIQTYDPEHYALRAAQEHDYHGFYVQEIAFRRQTRYPPFGRLVRFIYASSSTAACQRATLELTSSIATHAERLRLPDWGLIGPAPAYMQRMRGRWRWHLLVRTTDPLPLLEALGPLPGWTVDVDPVQML